MDAKEPGGFALVFKKPGRDFPGNKYIPLSSPKLYLKGTKVILSGNDNKVKNYYLEGNINYINMYLLNLDSSTLSGADQSTMMHVLTLRFV